MVFHKPHSRGFTVAEIMVTLAVAGILAAMAIPNLNRYTFTAKQKKAKAELSGLYSSMKAFFGEYAKYTTRFDANGYRPEGDQDYMIGFAMDVQPPLGALPGLGTCIATKINGAGNPATPACSYTVAWTNNRSAIQVPGLPAASASNQFQFTAYALGQINGVTIDSWSEDNSNALTNLNPGVGL